MNKITHTYTEKLQPVTADIAADHLNKQDLWILMCRILAGTIINSIIIFVILFFTSCEILGQFELWKLLPQLMTIFANVASLPAHACHDQPLMLGRRHIKSFVLAHWRKLCSNTQAHMWNLVLLCKWRQAPLPLALSLPHSLPSNSS